MRNRQTKPFVWLHSDSYIPNCGCDGRQWRVDLPDGWMYADVWAEVDVKAIFTTHAGAMDYAAQLHPGHPDVVPTRPDCTCWVDPKFWFSHYGAIEPGSQMEYDPECPVHGEAEDQ